MPNFESLLPPTVIAAAIIFIIKEVLDIVRDVRASIRKVKAYKKILAEELERNFWTWKSLRRAVTGLQSYRELNEGFSHKVIVAPSGSQHLEIRYEDGSLSSGSTLPNALHSSFERVLVGLAEENQDLYYLASDAYDEISEIGHVRASLINELALEDDIRLDGFLEYAVETLDSAIGPIQRLYLACTGKKLEHHKLR